MSRFIRAFGTALVLHSPLLLAAGPTGNFELDPERVGTAHVTEGKRWQEGSVALAAWPKDMDLVEWKPEGANPQMRYFVDKTSLKIDREGDVVRYVLVIQPPSGTRNVSFEGIHCTLRGDYKVYAYGVEGRFERAPPADWEPITESGAAYRFDLFRHRFCVPRETEARPIKDMIRALRGRVSANESTGFQAD